MRRRFGRSVLASLGAALVVSTSAVLTAALPVRASSPSPGASARPTPSPPPSGVGDEDVQWIAVSPAYRQTGLVAALTAQTMGCSKDCSHLWVSHDGGSTWHRAKAQGWGGGMFDITVDAGGRDVLYATGPQRSTDGGETWTKVGTTGGIPTPSSSYAKDATVAVASGNHDYVLRGDKQSSVAGSGGSMVDYAFSFAPTFPDSGRFSPAFLVGLDTSKRAPVVERCSASFSCGSPATLAGMDAFSLPVTIHPSTDFAHDGTVFAKAGRGIFKSTDGGATFAPVPVVAPGATASAYAMMALAPGYKEAGPVRTAYVSVLEVFSPPQAAATRQRPRSSGGIYRTTNGGATWLQVGHGSPLDNGASAVAVAPDGRLFAGYLGGNGSAHNGLLCSSNGGGTWQASCSPVGGSARQSGGSAAGCVGAGCVSPASGGGNGVSSGSRGASGVGGPSGAGVARSGGVKGVVGTVRHRWPYAVGGAGVLIGVLALLFRKRLFPDRGRPG